MSRILVILDGAPEPLRDGPTSLEAAATPALDALCAAGSAGRVRTTPAGFAPGSETGLPALVDALPGAPVGRGAIEAAAAGIDVPAGCAAWRIDLRHRDGRRASAAEARAALPALRAALPDHTAAPLRGHRLLAIGERRPVPGACGALRATVWPDGAALESVLDDTTTWVCGPGAAAGIGRLLGGRVLVPAGATGDTDSDLAAKATAALRALEDDDDVVVHVAGADEAAHRRERAAKRALLEAVDALLVAPLHAAAQAAGATIAVTADHGTCPRTGLHDAAPVPFAVAGPGIPASGIARLTERAVAGAPVSPSPWPRELAAYGGAA